MSGLELIPETVVEDTGTWTIAVNSNQDLLGKTMVVLNRPCSEVVGIEPEEWMALHHQLGRLVPALVRLFGPDQVNFAFLMNQDAQVHLHVIPRYAGTRSWSGMTFVDPHWGAAFGHEQRRLANAELGHMAAQIRSALSPTGHKASTDP